MFKDKRALSPVIAAIILIVITVAVSIAVAVWLGAITLTFMAPMYEDEEVVNVTDNFRNQSKVLSNLSITLIQTEYKAKQCVEYRDFDDFLAQVNKYNVDYVATDFEPFSIPRRMYADTLYNVANYRIWFFIYPQEVGKTAIMFLGSETAWWESGD